MEYKVVGEGRRGKGKAQEGVKAHSKVGMRVWGEGMKEGARWGTINAQQDRIVKGTARHRQGRCSSHHGAWGIQCGTRMKV